ncbi:Ubiquitin thioesterase otulin [Nymphon striatum]|nr:Ubiquitin thioesterase otulin [Nymphon striatum]
MKSQAKLSDSLNKTSAEMNMKASIVSSESGFLDSMVCSVDSPPSEDVVDGPNKFSEQKTSSEKNSQIVSMIPIEAKSNLFEFIKESSCKLTPTIKEKLEKEISSDSHPISAIKADNTGIIRAMTFQILSINNEVAKKNIFSSSFFQSLTDALNGKDSWIKHWNFLHIPECSTLKEFASTVEECINALNSVKLQLEQQDLDYEKRANYLTDLFNNDNILEMKVLDVVKLKMMATAMELYDNINIHSDESFNDGPLFPILLFAQERTNNPKRYFRNHLKNVGITVAPNESTRNSEEDEQNLTKTEAAQLPWQESYISL